MHVISPTAVKFDFPVWFTMNWSHAFFRPPRRHRERNKPNECHVWWQQHEQDSFKGFQPSTRGKRIQRSGPKGGDLDPTSNTYTFVHFLKALQREDASPRSFRSRSVAHKHWPKHYSDMYHYPLKGNFWELDRRLTKLYLDIKWTSIYQELLKPKIPPFDLFFSYPHVSQRYQKTLAIFSFAERGKRHPSKFLKLPNVSRG